MSRECWRYRVPFHAGLKYPVSRIRCSLNEMTSVLAAPIHAALGSLGAVVHAVTLPAMDTEPLPSILAAIEQGRGNRSGPKAKGWSRYRAQVLSHLASGLAHGRIAGTFGVSVQQLRLLLAEGCDAVVRGGAVSADADAVCAGKWRDWCARGDAAACARLAGKDAPSVR